jgi:hypothetical protein
MGWTNPEDDQDLENRCAFCGEECVKTYCDSNCAEADIND